jgi:hypothetical protein
MLSILVKRGTVILIRKKIVRSLKNWQNQELIGYELERLDFFWAKDETVLILNPMQPPSKNSGYGALRLSGT